MSHLGEDVTALVDGQLPPGRAEELLAHVVGCEECAAAIATERDARLRLAAARDMTPSVELTSRLIAMAAEPPQDNRGARALVDVALRPLTSGRTRRRLVARSGFVLAGAAGVAGVLVIVGTLVEQTGDPSAMVAQLTGAAPGRSQLVVSPDTVGLTAEKSAPDTTRAALSWLQEHGWSAPAALPDGLRVSHVDTVHGPEGDQLLQMELVGQGRQVMILEQYGVLDPVSVADLPVIDLGKHDAYELPVPGTALVLQAGDITVLVAASTEDGTVAEVAAAFPATAPGSDMSDRLDRGWQTLVGWTDLIAETR
ncbi:zf-HC2 domain-containing protein [Georgenia yuyongxinii]|uniref:Zf-HC2 domain-containing protein n=1 Tax=Georgenia yuyongxinii TaxID=2589797 RepID=A0A5B8C060_9MICO|nr:zf-HC2 domain-containing protein [Georgenia yuyongxinii]QDC24069.1 zf-HC2 domain-containing protein [Georgenia yuyongxinii]